MPEVSNPAPTTPSPSPAELELHQVYGLLKTILPHFPESMKLSKTIASRMEAIGGVLEASPWRPLSEYKAPKKVMALMPDGSQIEAHWACDYSGEDQPPFEGWFKGVYCEDGKLSYYTGIDTPLAWRELEKG